ncbi:heterokaryon incompatibility protein-domain-containing protein [Cladorrhinum sp. PSN259]|nr:heterokaryon incompatibility protein-domain-containing protein [Cladorrhinum sp. PSN259]
MAYPYQELDLPRETRVLTIQPSENESDDIICSLTHIDIDKESGNYEALSYCWSKSVSDPPDLLDEDVSYEVATDSGTELRVVKPRDLLGHPRLEYIYIKCGGVLPDDKIFCDGFEVRVGGELFRALRHLRRFRVSREAPSPLRLWVDAICINQENIEERNEHVKVMGLIYARAAAVRIWLGESIGVEYEAVEALKQIESIFVDKLREGSPWPDNDPGSRDIVDDERWNGIRWSALSQFLGRAWFDRIWVVQEIFHAREAWIHAGNLAMLWDHLAVILGYVRGLGLDYHLSHPSSSKALAIMTSLREYKKRGCFGKFDLAVVLEEVRNLKATISSDKVYGAVGLFLDQPEITSVQVDYTKRTEEVFTDVAIDYLQRRNSLAILSHCVLSTRPRTSPPLQLPSWVPDWSAPGWTEPFRNRKLPCKAAGDTTPSIREINRATGTLRLRGRRLDRVCAVDYTAQVPELEFSFPEGFGAAMKEERLAKLSVLEYRERSNIFLLAITNTCRDEGDSVFIWDSTKHENLWRTYMCNRTRGGKIPDQDLEQAWDLLLRLGLRFMRIYEEVIKVEKKSGTKATLPFALNATKALIVFEGDKFIKDEIKKSGRINLMDKTNLVSRGHRTWTYHRRFFVSSNRRFGWGVDGTKVGDEIVMFYGCDYPFVMRRDECGRGWRIIGDCYIHGLMDGEGLAPQFEECEFVIV